MLMRCSNATGTTDRPAVADSVHDSSARHDSPDPRVSSPAATTPATATTTTTTTVLLRHNGRKGSREKGNNGVQ